MKRKINRVGQNTLTVSIPNKWAKKMGLEPGDEVEVHEDNDTLVIGSSPKLKKSRIFFDVSGLGSMINRTLAATYKSGFFSVTVQYRTAQELQTIQDQIERTFHSFEVFNITENKVEAKAIANLNPENFDNIYRRIGFCVTDMANECLEGIKRDDHKRLETVVVKDKLVDRHTDFCRRVINIGYEIKHEKTGPLYVICEQSEILADIYKVMAKEIIDKKMKVAKDLQELLKEINKMIKYFYEVVNNFSLRGVKELGLQEIRIKDKIEEVCSKARKDAKIICHMNNIFETCFEMKSALLTMNLAHMGEDS